MQSLVISLLIVGIIIGFCVWRNNQTRKNALHGELNRELKALDDSMSEPEANQVDVEADGEGLLIKAILEQKDVVVDWLLEKGVSPNTRDENDVPALFLAVKCNSLNIVKKLIRAGADVNAMDRQGNTALFCVKSVNVCRKLINAGTVVTALNQDNQTPLFFPEVYLENDNLIAELVKQGIDPNHKDNFGKNALFYAKSADSIEELTKVGVDPNYVDSDGKTPIFYVHNRKLALALIQNGANLVLTDHQGKGIPILKQLRKTLDCPEYRDLPNVRKLLDLNRDLSIAVTQQNVSRVKELLVLGADPNCFDPDCSNAVVKKNMMTLAIERSALEIIQLLANAGASVHELNMGVSPLMRAACDGKPECFEMLLNLGANPKDNREFSFPEFCKNFNSFSAKYYNIILKKLLDCGVKRTKEVWEAAFNKGNQALIDILLNYSPEPSKDCFGLAVKYKNKQAWMWQIEHGIPFNEYMIELAIEIDNNEFLKYAIENAFHIIDSSILRIAIEKNNVDFLKQAVEKGAEIDTLCLDKALSCNNSSCAMVILDSGVIPNATHIRMAVLNNMFSVFQRMLPLVPERDNKLLEDVCLEGNLSAIKLLVESGWMLSHACLVNAVKNGNSECAKYIIDHDIKPDRALLDLALRQNNPKAAEMLINCGIKTTAADLTAALNDNRTAIAEMLIRHGADLDHSHLRLAVEKKNTKCVSALLNKGVEPDCVDLYTCIDNEDVQSARAILKSDKLYSYNIADALDYAEEYSECKGIKRLLRKYDETGEI